MAKTEMSQKLSASGNQHILFTANRPEVVMSSGSGMILTDVDGNDYLDFVGGWAVTALGHCPPVLVQAITQQAQTLVNASPSFYNQPMVEFAELLTQHSCMDRVFFTSTGAEANESAIKLARKYGALKKNGAWQIITTINSFHGRTLATMSATGKHIWADLFNPKVPGFVHVPYNDMTALKAAVTPETCAIMLEPIQGEGGVRIADQLWLKELRKLCDEEGILLIYDEIQTGMGRTGTMFAYEHDGYEPDIMTLGKGIGGGFPLAAMLCKEELNIFEVGDQGGSYCGQPLAMSVGLAVTKELMRGKWAENAKIQGGYLMKCLREVQNTYRLKDIRGRGLLVAFDIPTLHAPDLVAACLKNGLLINAPGPHTIRLMPPLIVTADDIDRMLLLLFETIVTMQAPEKAVI